MLPDPDAGHPLHPCDDDQACWRSGDFPTDEAGAVRHDGRLGTRTALSGCFDVQKSKECKIKKNKNFGRVRNSASRFFGTCPSGHITADKMCCVHAEQRAILDALKNNPDKITDSRLYFIRLNENGIPSRAGKPYCTICSKMALDVGIKEFVLWHEQGVCVYNTDEYNAFSFQYTE